MNFLLKNILPSIVFISSCFISFAQEDSIASVEVVEPATIENYFTPKTEQTDPLNVQLRQVPGKEVDSLKKLDAFWYADSAFGNKKKLQREEPDKPVFNKQTHWLNTQLFVIIMIIALGLIIFFLLRSNIVATRGPSAQAEGEQPESENIFDINYRKELEKAIANKNYRLAVRLMFLRQLKILSEKNIIQYKQERTNFDYLMQMHSSSYYRDFFRLTRNYEYVWYGKFELQPETFNVIKSEFENFDSKLS